MDRLHSWLRASPLMEQLAKRNEDDPRIEALSIECDRLEPLIIATPARTKVGLAAKRRLIASRSEGEA